MNWYIFFDILKSKVLDDKNLNKLLSNGSLKPYLREPIDISMLDSLRGLDGEKNEKKNIIENIKKINKKIEAGEIYYLQTHPRSVREIFEYESMSKTRVAPIITTHLSSSFY